MNAENLFNGGVATALTVKAGYFPTLIWDLDLESLLRSLCSPARGPDHALVSSPISTQLILQSCSCQSWTADAPCGDAALRRKDPNYSGPRKNYSISECEDGIIQKQPEESCLFPGCGVKKASSRWDELGRRPTAFYGATLELSESFVKVDHSF